MNKLHQSSGEAKGSNVGDWHESLGSAPRGQAQQRPQGTPRAITAGFPLAGGRYFQNVSPRQLWQRFGRDQDKPVDHCERERANHEQSYRSIGQS